MKNLKIYSDDFHPHSAQQPIKINIAILNNKNSRRDEINDS